MNDFDKYLVAEAQKQWEITKGNLQASVSILGAKYSGDLEKLEDFQRRVDEFIKDIEGYERHLP